jgi:F-type H+-transporting ATPase subunit gamma
MPTLKEFNVKLARLRSTRKMTKTMKLVSANKLRRSQDAQRQAERYTARLGGIVARLLECERTDESPLCVPRREVRHVLVLVIASDRGLCGGFNHALNRKVAQWAGTMAQAGRQVAMSFCGRRGAAHFRGQLEPWQTYENVVGRPRFEDARHIGAELESSFLNGRFDEIYLAYNAGAARGGFHPEIFRMLPLEAGILPDGRPAAGDAEGWLFEPIPAEFLAALLPLAIHLKVHSALLSSAVGEHGARMRAMDQATANADRLIGSLTLLRNRARQAEITTELTEIVAGAEALS